jgi:uncharacterized membrane protein
LPGATQSSANGINNSGQIVGSSTIGSTVATIWNGTTPTALGSLPGGTYSYANGINNSGQVVGYGNSSFNNGGNYFATVWNGNTPVALGNLLGAIQSSGLTGSSTRI